ncbi:hypothetical protein ACP275_04G139400 [Erythranthe tilingii]
MLTAAPPLFFSTQSPAFFFLHFDFLCRPIITEDFTFVPHSHGSGRPAILDSRPLPCPPPPPRSPPTASAASVAFHRIFPPPAPPRLLLHFQNSDSPSGSVGHLKNSQLPPPPLTGTFSLSSAFLFKISLIAPSPLPPFSQPTPSCPPSMSRFRAMSEMEIDIRKSRPASIN